MLHGILLINKPSGITSHKVVEKIRRLFQQKLVGHCGTLDPMATGLLIMVLGKASKLSSYLLNESKTYNLTMQLGKTTDTLDITGKIVSQTHVPHVPKEEIKKTLKETLGEWHLPVPKYSAIKIKGKKLYEYAREDVDIPLPKKKMYFYDLIIHQIQHHEVSVTISCSKGSYIRSWISMIGEKLHIGACLSQLQRVTSAPYHIHQSISLESLEKNIQNDGVRFLEQKKTPYFISFSSCLPHFQKILFNNTEEKQFLNGKLPLSSKQIQATQKQIQDTHQETYFQIMGKEERLLGIISIKPSETAKIQHVFPHNAQKE